VVCDLGFPVTARDCASWQDRALGSRAAEGHSRLLRHLCETGLYTPGPADMRAVCRWCSKTGLATVRWLHARGVPTHGPAADFEGDFYHGKTRISAPDFLTLQAAGGGLLELLQVLVEEFGVAWTESACKAAADSGHTEVLRWAISKGCPCGVDTWCAAVVCANRSGDYRPLELLHRERRPWSEAVWEAAADDLEVRAWLQARGCPGSPTAPETAAAAGAGAGAGAGLA